MSRALVILVAQNPFFAAINSQASSYSCFRRIHVFFRVSSSQVSLSLSLLLFLPSHNELSKTFLNLTWPSFLSVIISSRRGPPTEQNRKKR